MHRNYGQGCADGRRYGQAVAVLPKTHTLRGNGKTYLSHSAAIVLAQSRVVLVGTDAESIAPPFDEVKTHLELGRADIAVLENLNLSGVADGEYDLCAFPIKLGGVEAAPCRAILFEQEKGLN